MAAVNEHDLAFVFRQLVYARLGGVFISAIGLSFLWLAGWLPFNPQAILLGLIPAYFIIGLIWYWLLRKRIFSRAVIFFQIFADILAITAAIYLSDGMHSDIAFFYLVAVITATMISRAATILTGLAALAFYGALIVGETLGFVPQVGDTHFGFQADEAVRMSVFLFLTIILAFQSRYFISQLKKGHEEILRIKDGFLFRTVHGLRSPAATIRWIMEKWTSPEMRGRYPETREDVAAVSELNDRILHLIQDLLDLAKGKEMVFKKEALNLPEIIRKVASEMKPAMAKRGVILNYRPKDSLPMVLGDGEQIQEIFENLLDNAIKYNKEGGSITISHAVENDFLKTAVADTGKGITTENLAKLFTPYIRFNGKGLEGTGLGLYIVKTLAEKMGGKISVESEVSKGATFFVYLPVAKI